MATVPDKAGRGVLDNSYDKQNRVTGATPLNALTPEYSGEIVLDTTAGVLYQAQSPKIDSWVVYSRGDGHR